MKSILILLGLCLITLRSLAQDPTLSAGLNALTLNKGTIDVQVLTAIIMDKQKELKQEALKRFMLSVFPETNYTTKFYIQNCLTILFNEKNPQVIEKEILELTTNYALAIGITKACILLKSDCLNDLNKAYASYKTHSLQYRNKLLADFETSKLVQEDIASLTKELSAYNEQIYKIIDTLKDKPLNDRNKKDYENLKSLEKERKKKEDEINRIKLRNNIAYETDDTVQKGVPFGIVLDAVSFALSDMDELKKKGFFKKTIDYRNDAFYINLTKDATSTTDPKTALIDQQFKQALDSLPGSIKKMIAPYVINYDLIKEFYSAKLENSGTGKINIKDQLINSYMLIIQSITEKDGLDKLIRDSGVNSLSESADKQLETYFDAIQKAQLNLKPLDNYGTGLVSLQNLSKNHAALIKNNEVITLKYDTLNHDGIAAKKIGDFEINHNSDTTKDPYKSLIGLSKQYKDNQTLVTTLEASFKKQLEEINALRLTIQLNTPLNITIEKADAFVLLIQIKDSIKTSLGVIVKDNTLSIVRTGYVLDGYLKTIIQNFLTIDALTVTVKADSSTTESVKKSMNDYSDFIATVYGHLNQFTKQNSITLKDINYIDDEAIPQFIKFAVVFDANDKVKKNIQAFRLLSQLLKIKAVLNIGDLTDYTPVFLDLFAFIKNLDNLDRAQTYQAMLNLLQDANGSVEANLDDGKFKEVYMVFSNAIKKYTLINTKDQYVQIDVLSFLTDLQHYFDRNNNSIFGLYLTLGLNQNMFFGQTTLPGTTEPLKYIGFASEKIGVKLRFHSFNLISGYENAIKNDVNLNKKAPFVNEWYGIIYGSGLLYSIANTSTSSNFNYPHIGIGTGIRFYNALDLNFVVGFPFVKNQPISNFAFYGFGLDIPLGEYLEKLGNKKQ